MQKNEKITMKTEDLATMARLSEDYGFDEMAGFFDREWQEAVNLEKDIKRFEWGEKWLRDCEAHREQIAEFREEVGEDERRKMRMEFLEDEIMSVVSKIREFEDHKKIIGEWFLFDDELDRLNKKYKFLYIEYATWKSYEADDREASEETIQRCREVPINSLVGASFSKAGARQKRAKCMFHQDKIPSFFLYPDNSYHCFGCGAHGNNAIDFIMALNKFSFIQAIEYLKNFI